MKKVFRKTAALVLCLLTVLSLTGLSFAEEEAVVLRVCNWEEYIDLGEWGEDEVIDLESGDIIGVNPMVTDFENWYYETYGVRVRVEYSTFGTNEDLYNMLTLGDVYDIVCPSEYMIMKLIAEDRAFPLSESFFDPDVEENYYVRGVSPYIRSIFESHEINGQRWDRFAAGFMWGVTGFVYNPEIVTAEEASTWHLLENTKFARQITVKDNVRDTYFAAVGALKSELLLSEEFRADPDYPMRLQDEMNDTSPEMVDRVQDYLQSIKGNLYSFETDSGKADMITGKVVANFQWSGDAVYAMDQAEGDDFILEFAVPQESTDVYFDGWIMLRCGVEGDPAKQHAAEAFINFVSRPDNAIRNMYYIGYTSVISNCEDGRIMEYLEWNYGADEDDETAVPYSVAHFFTDDPAEAEAYVIMTPEEQLRRQLSAQYPSEEVLERASIMVYFDGPVSERTNRMWIRVRCYNIHDVPVWAWIMAALIVLGVAYLFIRNSRRRNAENYYAEAEKLRRRKG